MELLGYAFPGAIEDAPAEYTGIELLPARNLQTTMRFQEEGKVIYVHSAYAPDKEARVLAEGVRMCYDSVFIIFGMGLMYHVNALAARAYPKCKILIIEPDYRVFDCAIREVELSGAFGSGKTALSVAQDEGELKKFLKKELTPENFMQTEIVVLPAYTAWYPEKYAAFQRALSEVKEQRGVENLTISNQNKHWTENILRNIKYMPQSFRHWSFSGVFGGKPGVIVSAGPSLDKNVKLLAKLKGKALIIATYSSLKTLRKHDIIPDIVVAIDRLQAYFHDRNEPVPLTAPLLYIPSADYRLLEKAEAEKILAPMQDDLYILELYSRLGYEEGQIFVAGSVAITAADFVATAGCDPVIFIGQDLAFTDKRLHSEGVDDNDEFERFLDRGLASSFPVDDVSGGKVLTDSTMDMYRRVLEGYIRYDAENSGRGYIDATEGGALIAGTDVLSLAEAIERTYIEYLPDEISGMLKEHFADRSNLAPGASHTATFWQEFVNLHRDIEGAPNIIALATIEAVEGHDIEKFMRITERAIESMEELTHLFPNEYRHARNQFMHLHGQEYINGKISSDAQEAYIMKCAMTARMILESAKRFNSNEAPWIKKEIEKICK